MATVRLCDDCGVRPVRKRRGARWCSPCVRKQPHRECAYCDKAFPPDMMNGPRCKPCQSKLSHEKRVGETYGLKPGQYDELLEHQGGMCFICRRRPASKRLAVDHDHGNGLVRGLLCRGCNRDVLGHLRDSIAALYRAIEYLESPPAQELWGEDTPKQPEATV